MIENSVITMGDEPAVHQGYSTASGALADDTQRPHRAATCAWVGYKSPSQFSQEFRRMFGRSPGEEANRMKHSLQLVAMDV